MASTSSTTTLILLNCPTEQVSSNQCDSKLVGLHRPRYPVTEEQSQHCTSLSIWDHWVLKGTWAGTQERPVGNLASQKGYGSKEIHFKTQQNYFYLRLTEISREAIKNHISITLMTVLHWNPTQQGGHWAICSRYTIDTVAVTRNSWSKLQDFPNVRF